MRRHLPSSTSCRYTYLLCLSVLRVQVMRCLFSMSSATYKRLLRNDEVRRFYLWKRVSLSISAAQRCIGMWREGKRRWFVTAAIPQHGGCTCVCQDGCPPSSRHCSCSALHLQHSLHAKPGLLTLHTLSCQLSWPHHAGGEAGAGAQASGPAGGL